MFRIICFIILLFVFVPQVQAQEYLIEGKSATIVYEVPEKSKSELFQGALDWFEKEESASEYTVESSNPKAGIIKVSEINQVYYKNIGKLMYPKRSGMAEMLSGDFSYDIELVFEEGTYMVKYMLTGM